MLHLILRYKKVILASTSPRRAQIFSMLNIPFITMNPDYNEEELSKKNSPYKFVQVAAKQKVISILPKITSDSFVIGADTIVFQKGQIITKPTSIEDATKILNRLSGKKHTVYTGICIFYKGKIVCDYSKTSVYFYPINKSVIHSYILTKEPFDKAGGYGFQGIGGQFIERINGCAYNVIGFPVSLFAKLTKKIIDDKS